VVVSSALKHKIDDKEGLLNYLKNDDFIEGPAGRSDDYFIIQLALEKDAFIISNDQFKDWREVNPDLAEQIEERRVAFTFVDGKPSFDHKLGKLIKRPL